MLKKMMLNLNLPLKSFIYAGVLLVVAIVFNQNVILAQGEFHGSTSMPVYQGGIKALKEFIANNLNYPVEAKKAGISGIVQVIYLINKEGSVENIKIMKGISPECDNEAIRVTHLITGWKPAVQMGMPVNVMVSMPVEFQSDKKLQPVDVTGIITDKSNGKPLEGALVIVKGTSEGTITNADGSYRLGFPRESQYLEFSSLGYGTKVEPIGNHSIINVELDKEYFIIDFNTLEN
jgi:TonB family protein